MGIDVNKKRPLRKEACHTMLMSPHVVDGMENNFGYLSPFIHDLTDVIARSR